MEPTTRPLKVDQVAALMRLVFEANPNRRMTRREIESALDLEEFSVSTRRRALNLLFFYRVIQSESGWPEAKPSTYWMPVP